MKYILGVAVVVLVLSGCAHNQKDVKKPGSPVFYALADMNPTKGNKTSGKVWFSEGFGKVKVEAEISGLDANSKHGFHIHEFGDCTAADGASAGGHYNPDGVAHGVHDNKEGSAFHAGDLGNLISDKKGNAKLVVEVQGISLNSGVNPIVGRGLIIHKSADDYITQPTGGAGARISCGVIGAATR
jgi:superoxide dismutase, Cu-Zn family